MNKRDFIYIKNIFLFFIFAIFLIFTSCSTSVNPPPIIIDNEVANNNNKIDKKNTNILFLLYMDGDNDLAVPIGEDFDEVIDGVNLLEEKDNVEIIVLWDGKDYGDSYLYRIDKTEGKIDINDSAKWIFSLDDSGIIKNEVSMSDPKTLENFLRWANLNYNYDYLILQISDHGAGPGSIYEEDMAPRASKAMCEDLNKVPNQSTQPVLGTKDVPLAIKSSGINKVDLVIQDVCFGCSVEEVYEYKNCADYMLLSPNSMPAGGLNYKKLISHLSEGDCVKENIFDIEKFLNCATSDFIDEYRLPQRVWEQMKEANKNVNLQGQSIELYLSLQAVKSKSFILSTITGIKVKEIENVKNELCKLARNIDDKSKKSLCLYFYNLFNDMGFYASPMGHLFDISYFCQEISLSKEPGNLIGGESSKWLNIKNAAKDIKKSVDDVIVCSWRDGYGGALYNKSSRTDLKGIGPFANGSFGLPVVGITFIEEKHPVTGLPVVNPYLPGRYDSDLNFGKDKVWLSFLANIITKVRN